MSTATPAPSLALIDSLTMLRRNLRHMRRYPSMTVMLIAQPIVFLLLFVFVFGQTMGNGLAGGGRSAYLAYIAPAIVIQTVCSVALGTSVSVASDMTTGIVSRFRTMPIARASVLTGHVVGAVLQTVFALAVVLGVAVLIGYRPQADVVGWLGVLLLLAAVTFSLTWLCVALGLLAGSVETASNLPMPLVLLPFLGSGFVPADSMPVGIRWFAEYQPFTPMIETLRHLLQGQSVGGTGLVAAAWCLAIAVAGFAWSVRLYNTKNAG